ncbi:MAG: L,D-transpeptidase family protein [Planctomycetota bacterium]
MGLPSQSGARVMRRGKQVKRGRRSTVRRKRGISPPVVFVLLAILGGSGWLAISMMTGPSAATAGENTTATNSADDTRMSLPPAGGESMAANMPSMEELTEQMDAQAVTAPLPDPEPLAAAPETDRQTQSVPTTSSDARRAFDDMALAALIDQADGFVRQNQPVAARRVLNAPLVEGRLDNAQARVIRNRIAQLNESLVFSPRVDPMDPFSETYRIEPGDSLARIASKRELAVDWRFVQRINGIANARRIRAGQTLKLVRGPFHVRVDKSDYRADLFIGPPDLPEEWTYIRSFDVGLGESDSTPIGTFKVRTDSKLINPHWVNPRTGEEFMADDPMNPIGERWIGIEGVGADAVYEGYGLHGTIDPDSIGDQESMGCVRMDDESIAIVYEALVEGLSMVLIDP